MLDPRRYHYQPTISFPVISDDISLQQKPHTNNNNNICQTKNINNDPHDQSGMCSPPLWTTKSKSTNYRSLSPESKIEAIERGQRELMEMVKNMPESSYELTLTDLVEEQQQQQHRHHHVEEINNSNRVVKQKSLNNKKANRREGMMDKRSISTGHGNNIDSGGFYLKMVFPISLGSSKKQYYKKNKESSLVNSNNSNNNNSKVSPRTSSVSDHGSVNKDWWKKKKSGSECGGESDHSASTKRSGSISTSSSCSSRSNTSRHEISASSCWPFTRRSEILTQK